MKKTVKSLIYWCVVVMLWETVFHLAVWRGFTVRYLYSVPFSLSLAVFFTALSGIWPWKKANAATSVVILSLMGFLFSVQTVYQWIFKSLLSMTLLGEGGKAITSFFDIMMDGIFHCLPYIIIYFLPIPALALLSRRGFPNLDFGGAYRAAVLLCVAVLTFSTGVPSEDSDSARAGEYYDLTASIGGQAEHFGLVTGERLELARLVSDNTGLDLDVSDLTVDPPPVKGPEPGNSEGNGSNDAGPELNIIQELDFEKLLAAAQTDQERELTQYFSGLTGTNKNDFTGLFKGFNLIEICVESYWPYMVDPVLTPALYKLTHEGIIFDNFYCSFFNTTTNGEYSLCMGMMPDFNRMSFSMSTGNFLPQTLAHAFLREGVQPLAYHDFTGFYYGRAYTHPNMGFIFKAPDFGYEPDLTNHASDLEMFERSVDDYIGQDRFFAYYMTFSGHVPYAMEGNRLVEKNYDAVKDLDYPEDVKCYLATSLEFEYAMEYLLDRLEEAGVADRTVIVLTGDHYPYGLSQSGLEALAGDAAEEDPYWLYRNSFVCWSGAIEEPIHVDTPCCTQDILPTMLNLLGMKYDSRLLTGMDVFSDATHLAVLQDGSFVSEDMRYDAPSGEVTYLTPDAEPDPERAERLAKAVKNQFAVSAAILRSDYYRFAYGTLDLESVVDQDLEGSPFFDVLKMWYKDQVIHLARLGAVTGSGINYYGEDPVTMRDFAAMVTVALELTVPARESSPFTDLHAGDAGYEDMLGLWNAGVIDGGKCSPEGNLTLEDALLFAGRLADHFGFDREEFQSLVEYASQTSLENGGSADPMTRGAAAYFVDGIRELLNAE